MDTWTLEKDLHRRIDQSREWINSENISPLENLRIRNFPCMAEPISFLDEPKRKERHGVRFRLVIDTAKGEFESFIDIRIKPECSMSRDGETVANGPYVVIYAVDQDKNVGDEITHEHLENPKKYEGIMESLSIQDWYTHWLRQALNHRKIAKVFGLNKPTRLVQI